MGRDDPVADGICSRESEILSDGLLELCLCIWKWATSRSGRAPSFLSTLALGLSFKRAPVPETVGPLEMEAAGEPRDALYKKCREIRGVLRTKTSCDVATFANAHSHNSPHLFACECILCEAANNLLAKIVSQRRSELTAFQLVFSIGNIFPFDHSPDMPTLLLSVRPPRPGREWERASTAEVDAIVDAPAGAKGETEKKGTSPFSRESLLLRDDVAALKDLYRLPDNFQSGQRTVNVEFAQRLCNKVVSFRRTRRARVLQAQIHLVFHFVLYMIPSGRGNRRRLFDGLHQHTIGSQDRFIIFRAEKLAAELEKARDLQVFEFLPGDITYVDGVPGGKGLRVGFVAAHDDPRQIESRIVYDRDSAKIRIRTASGSVEFFNGFDEEHWQVMRLLSQRVPRALSLAGSLGTGQSVEIVEDDNDSCRPPRALLVEYAGVTEIGPSPFHTI